MVKIINYQTEVLLKIYKHFKMNSEVIGHDGICLGCDHSNLIVYGDIIKSMQMYPGDLIKYKFKQIRGLPDGEYKYTYNNIVYIINKISMSGNLINFYIYGPETSTRHLRFTYVDGVFKCADKLI